MEFNYILFGFDDLKIRRKNFAKTTVFYEKKRKIFSETTRNCLICKFCVFRWGLFHPTDTMSICLFDIQNHLSALTAAHHIEALLEIIECEMMGDNG